MRFPSKKDWWLGLIIWSAALLPLLGLIYQGVLYPSLLALLLALFLAWIWFGTSYTITDTHLLVRCGPLRKRIPLESIRSISPSRDPLASPALSMDRLLIRYGKSGFLLVSPAQSDLFLREIRSRRSDQDDSPG